MTQWTEYFQRATELIQAADPTKKGAHYLGLLDGSMVMITNTTEPEGFIRLLMLTKVDLEDGLTNTMWDILQQRIRKHCAKGGQN